MIVVLEGTDLTGKSTVASALSKTLGIPVVRPWIDLNTPKPAVVSVARSLKALILATKPSVIYDRFFFSELPYAMVLGREHGYVEKLVNEWSEVPDLFIVHLTANDQTLRHRYEDRQGDAYVSLGQIIKTRDHYKYLVSILDGCFSVLTIDTTDKSEQETAIIIVDWLHSKKDEG
jgi:thymidylate kinase